MAKDPKDTKDDGIYTTADGPSKEAASGAPMSDDGKKLAQEATPKSIHSGDVKVTVKGQDGDLIAVQKEAYNLNIAVDPEWDINRLRAEIQMAREGRADLQVKGAVPPAGMGDVNYDPATKGSKLGVPVLLQRDYWHEGERVAAGKEIKVSKEEAQRLLNAGVATRNDPLPG